MKPTYEQKILALQLARARLEPGRQLLCYRLAEVAEVRPDLAPACEYLRDYIREVLEHHGTLTGWTVEQVRKHPGTYPYLQDYSQNVSVDHRKRWVDWMVEQYQQRIKERDAK